MSHLFVSDLHLDASTPTAVAAFRRLLRETSGRVERLYILGDLFETWVGDDDPDPLRASVCAELLALTQRGTRLFVMSGNRDFLYGPDFTRRTGAELLPDPVVALLEGRRILLTHGDLLCTEDLAYQELRSTMRDPVIRERLLALPLSARQSLAAAARRGSRAHTATTASNIMDVEESAVLRAFRASRTREMVHGHTHRPGEHRHEVDGETAIRRVLPAWHEAGGALELDAQGWRVRTYAFDVPDMLGVPE